MIYIIYNIICKIIDSHCIAIYRSCDIIYHICTVCNTCSGWIKISFRQIPIRATCFLAEVPRYVNSHSFSNWPLDQHQHGEPEMDNKFLPGLHFRPLRWEKKCYYYIGIFQNLSHILSTITVPKGFRLASWSASAWRTSCLAWYCGKVFVSTPLRWATREALQCIAFMLTRSKRLI